MGPKNFFQKISHIKKIKSFFMKILFLFSKKITKSQKNPDLGTLGLTQGHFDPELIFLLKNSKSVIKYDVIFSKNGKF